MSESSDTIFVEDGGRKAFYAVMANGVRPAQKDLEWLKKKKPRQHARLKAIVRQYLKTDTLPSSKMDGYTGSKIKKFKGREVHPYRLPFFEHNNDIVLTHLFVKESDKQIALEIKKAEKIMKEHLARVEE